MKLNLPGDNGRWISLLQESFSSQKQGKSLKMEKRRKKKLCARFLPNSSISCSNLKGYSERENEVKNFSLPCFGLCNKLHKRGAGWSPVVPIEILRWASNAQRKNRAFLVLFPPFPHSELFPASCSPIKLTLCCVLQLLLTYLHLPHEYWNVGLLICNFSFLWHDSYKRQTKWYSKLNVRELIDSVI